MRKKIKKKTAMIMALLVLLVMLPVHTSAAPALEDRIELQMQGNMLTVKLTLPNAAGEKISSLQLSLQLDSGSFSDFVFDEQVTGRAKVWEAYTGQEKRALNLYISGTAPLYEQGNAALTIGRVAVLPSGDTSVSVQAGDVKVVRGTQLEDKDLSETVQILFGTGQGSDPGYYVPGTVSPQQPSSEKDNPPVSDTDTEHPNDNPSEPGKSSETEQEIEAPHLSKIANAASGVTVKWSKSSNASGYYVYRRTVGGRWKRIAAVKGKNKGSYTDRAVKNKNGKTYIYTVKAYKGKKVSTYEKAGLKIYRLTAPSLSKPVSRSAKTMTVKWGQNKKSGGYQIQYGRSSAFLEGTTTKKITSAGKAANKIVSKKITKLKSKKTYYVRVRSYKKVGKATYYSSWSKAKKVKIR